MKRIPMPGPETLPPIFDRNDPSSHGEGPSASYRGLVIVIPTRNRGDLATRAIQSILGQSRSEDVQVLVSDNSSDKESARLLETYCRAHPDPRLTYTRPPRSMAMSEHWDWAMGKALTDDTVNHFSVLADRSVFKPGAIGEIKKMAAHFPVQVISYHHHSLLDHRRPIEVSEDPWSGKILALDSSRFLKRASECRIYNALPRMLNNVCPRYLLEDMKRRWGNVFASISPDYCFAFRCLVLTESFLFYDKPLITGYAYARSNGAAFLRGIASKESKDFEAQLAPGIKINDLSPIPEIRNAYNGIIHEYCFVRNETQSPKMPALDLQKYLFSLGNSIRQIEDPGMKEQMYQILRAKGWRRYAFSRIWPSISTRLAYLISFGEMRDIWRIFGNRVGNPRHFPTLEEAMEFTFSYPDQRAGKRFLRHLTTLFGPVVDCPQS